MKNTILQTAPIVQHATSAVSSVSSVSLPYDKLIAWQVARELLLAVRRANIRDTYCRQQAMKSARSCLSNTGEGAGRPSPDDKKRMFGIARGEAVEVASHVDVAGALGAASPEAVEEVRVLASRVYALLFRLST